MQNILYSVQILASSHQVYTNSVIDFNASILVTNLFLWHRFQRWM